MKYPEFIIKTNDFLNNIHVSLYDILLGVGIVVLMEYAIRALEKKNGYSRKATNKILLFMAVGLGIAYISALFSDALFHYFQSGVFKLQTITYIGGFTGGIVAFSILVYGFYPEEKKNILKILNIIIPGIVLAHALGRIGCFTAGCCYGRPTESFLGVYFPPGTNAFADGIRVKIHPTQLYEALFLFGLFFVLEYTPKINKHKFASYLVGYGVFRFFLEMFLRGDERGLLCNIPPSLLLSAMFIVVGIVIFIGTAVKNKTARSMRQ